MKHTRTGWWTLGGFAGLTLLGLYVVAYYTTVQPGLSFGSLRGTPHILRYEPHYGPLGGAGEVVFRPMYLVDRWLRPGYWSEEVYELPDVPQSAGKSAGEW